jgi:predicted  nucleic acid-binding Zn-ribbon protein
MNSLQDLFGLSFNSKLNNIQSSFQTAHDKAVVLISKMNDKISEKEEEVKKIQSEIKDIENIKAQANKFVGNLKSILV